MTLPTIKLTFPARWRAEILPTRPLILPPRHFVYPQAVEEVEKGALEAMIRPQPEASAAHPPSQPFLVTCALGFRDSIVPTGIFSCPNPAEICLLAGGYAYIVDTSAPARFTLLEMRPVLAVLPALEAVLLLFAGNRTVLAWGADGLRWQTEPLSDEGLTELVVKGVQLHGKAWQMRTDRECSFTLDLATGRRLESPDTRC